jgi:SAM-dependent methyltransferase
LSGEALCAAGVSKVTGTDVSPASIDLLASVKPGVNDHRLCSSGRGSCNLHLAITPTSPTPQVYSELIVADLDGEPLPFATDSFDGVTCVGVLSYITHFDHLFAEWIRVTRPNGYVVFTHRLWDGDAGTDSAADGSKAAAIALEARGLWKLVHESPPSPYMPGNPDPTERAKTIKYMAFQVA